MPWFDTKPNKTATSPRWAPSVPAGMRVYAVGDIHGRADLLGKLAETIGNDLRASPSPEPVTIFLGDYIDRGPASREVIERLRRNDFPTPIVTLRGNHEDVFGQFLRGTGDVAYIQKLGGDATLQSYGLDLGDLSRLDPEPLRDALRAAIPPEHRAFLERTAISCTAGDYFFCHAGARPGVPLDEQSEEDLMWIRDGFLKSDHDFGKVVVHGHTPVRSPEVRPNGINIDTKAFASGVLTALALEGTERRFLAIRL